MSSYSEAEMEQGELSASPDLQDSPGVRLDEEEEDDREEEEEVEQDQEERSSRRHEGDEDDDTLDIKPPQTHAGRSKDKKKHSKHRDERKRDRESARERTDDRASTRSRDRSKDRYKEESVKEPREKEKSRGSLKTPKDREMEDRRREKSRRERERLERLERERYRLEREAAREQLRVAEREKDRERAERHRRKEEAAVHDARRRLQDEHRRERSRDKHGSREKSRSPIAKHSSRDKDRSRRHEEDDRRRYRHDHGSPERNEGKDMEEEHLEEPEAPPPHKREEEDIHSPSGDERHSEESSRSRSVISHSEQSDVEQHSEEEEGRSDVEPEAPRRDSQGKFRSKFDDDRSIDEESDKDSLEITNEIDMDEDIYMEQTPPQSPLELKPELPPYYPALQGCRNVEEFHCLNKIEEGTYGVVFRARDKKADEIVALKKLKMEKEKEGFPITSLREINTLLKAQHVNIVTVREIVVGSNIDKIYIVMDYVEHDLKSLMETMREPFMIGEVKTLMIQLLRGVNHLHDNWIIHRDLKTSNLLLSHKGILKIGDFGLAREYGSPLKQYTPIVVTLWYRSPELLLGCKEYSTAIDMWSVGCIFGEFLTRKPLFPGKSELDELNRIFKDLGTPSEKIWPGVSELPGMKKCTFAEHPYNQLRNRFGSSLAEKGFDLMNRFLTYDPIRRINASEGLKHEYFQQEPLPVPPSMFPTWPAKSEMPRRTHGNSPKPPSGGKAYSKLLGDDDIGFHLTGATKGAAAIGHGFSLKF